MAGEGGTGSGGGVPLEEVRRIAALARLRIEEGEAGRLSLELGRILHHVRVLEEVERGSEGGDGEGSLSEGRPVRPDEDPPPFRPAELEPDALGPGGPGEGAPEWRDGFFLVPRLPALDEGGDG